MCRNYGEESEVFSETFTIGSKFTLIKYKKKISSWLD